MRAHPAPTATHCSDTATPQNAPRPSAPPPTCHLALHTPRLGTASGRGPATMRKHVKGSVTGALCPEGLGAQEDVSVCPGSLRSRMCEVGVGRGSLLPLGCPGSAHKASGLGGAQAVASRGQILPNCCYSVPSFEYVLLNLSKLVHSLVQSNSFSPKQAELDQSQGKGEMRGTGQGGPRGQVPHVKELRGREKMCLQMWHFEAFHWLAPTLI